MNISACALWEQYLLILKVRTSHIIHNKSLVTFTCILCSGLTDKTKLAFTASNSSYSECIRRHLPFMSLSSSFSTSYNEDCTAPDYKECTFTTPHLTPSSSSVSFTSCTFNSLESDSNGGAIYFTNNPSGTLTVLSCVFIHCSANPPLADSHGGGGIYMNSGSKLNVSLSTFFFCVSAVSGGGILAEVALISSLASECTFIECGNGQGGGLMTYIGPSSSVSSCVFISCVADSVGGGIYHDSTADSSSLTLSNCLFTNSCAKYKNGSSFEQTRGGGAFEDYRSKGYASAYSFSFFSGNTAPFGVGNDISINGYSLSLTNIQCCLTTTLSYSLWNKQYIGHEGWLPQTNAIIKVFDPRTTTNQIPTHTNSHDNDEYSRFLSK